MLCTQDDGDTERLAGLFEEVRDLLGEPFLHLKCSGVVVNDSSELAQSCQLLVRDVPDVSFTYERNDVVATQRDERDSFDDDHLVDAVAGKRCELDRLGRGKLPKHLHESLRRVLAVLVLRVESGRVAKENFSSLHRIWDHVLEAWTLMTFLSTKSVLVLVEDHIDRVDLCPVYGSGGIRLKVSVGFDWHLAELLLRKLPNVVDTWSVVG